MLGGEEEGTAIFNVMASKGLSDGVPFEQRPEMCEGVSQVDILRNSVPGRVVPTSVKALG